MSRPLNHPPITDKNTTIETLRPPPPAFLAPAVRSAHSACIALPRCEKKIGLTACSGDAVALGAFRQRSKHPRSAARRAVYCVRIYVITLNSMFTGCSWSRALQWCAICGARASALKKEPGLNGLLARHPFRAGGAQNPSKCGKNRKKQLCPETIAGSQKRVCDKNRAERSTGRHFSCRQVEMVPHSHEPVVTAHALGSRYAPTQSQTLYM